MVSRHDGARTDDMQNLPPSQFRSTRVRNRPIAQVRIPRAGSVSGDEPTVGRSHPSPRLIALSLSSLRRDSKAELWVQKAGTRLGAITGPRRHSNIRQGLCRGVFACRVPFYKFYGINCRPKLRAKLLDRFLHRRWQVSPAVNNLTHRFFDGSQHFLYCCHGRFSPSRCRLFVQWARCSKTAAGISSRKVSDLSPRMESSMPSRSCPPRTPPGAWPAASR